ADTEAVQAWRKLSPNPDSATAGLELLTYGQTLVFLEILNRMHGNFSWANFTKTAEALRNYESGILPAVSYGPLPNGHAGATGAIVADYENGKWVQKPDFVYPK